MSTNLNMATAEMSGISLPEGYTFVALTHDDKQELTDLLRWAFPEEQTTAEKLEAPWHLDGERTPGIRAADGSLAAMHSSHIWERFPLPGATARVAGLTEVSVHPEHRRRGLLTAMIRLHLNRCVERGELFSILTATEPVIYGRYGYGHASDNLCMKIGRGAALRPVAGSDEVAIRILALDITQHAQIIDRIHRSVGTRGALARPGWATRDNEALRQVELYENERRRRGKEELRLMLAERAGEPVGYALFTRSDVWTTWGDTGPDASVEVKECVGIDGAATHALWSRLLDFDLTSKTEAYPLPVDDPVVGMLVNFVATNPLLEELLWVRLVDLPKALAARQYSSDLDVVLEVSDALLPANAGRWHLRASAFCDDACVEPSTAPADVTLDIRELGAAYLGGTTLAALGLSGLVQAASDEALLRTAAAFQWPINPACNWHF